MIKDNSDSTWEKLGKENPYYGVLTDEKFRRENLNFELKAEFFESGRAHVEWVLAMAYSHFGSMASQKSALDFGCGVGRLVIPLAQIFDHVTGIDVSPSMLGEAEKNCLDRDISNFTSVRSDDELTQVEGTFDFIHSYIVLQHIPIHRGEKIIRQLLIRLRSKGILAIHFPFMRKASAIRKAVNILRKAFSPLSVLVNIIQGKRWNEPFMQMNSYDINRILIILSEHGIEDAFVKIIDTGGYLQAFVLAKKP